MRLVYLLLSPTFGMHQYTAGPANRMAQAGHEVHLVTTARFPRDRYHPAITIHTPVNTRGTGLSLDTLRLGRLARAYRTVRRLQPDVVHFTGPHLWNVPLLWLLRRAGIPTVHTVHDVDPHHGTSRLLYLWNRAVYRLAGQILVHGQCYHDRLLAQGLPPERVTYTPLLHLFLGHDSLAAAEQAAPDVTYEPWALFFGRLEPYKGVKVLLDACSQLVPPPPPAGEGGGRGGGGLPPAGERGGWGGREGSPPQLVLAGPGPPAQYWPGAPPPNVEVRNRLIGDEEGIDLFRRCGLLVLPYTAATQSALVAAAYFFHKPVLVTRSGALPEYVRDGETGWIVPPGDAAALAQTLAEALSDPGRLARMGQAGRSWYEEQYSVEGETLQGMYRYAAR